MREFVNLHRNELDIVPRSRGLRRSSRMSLLPQLTHLTELPQLTHLTELTQLPHLTELPQSQPNQPTNPEIVEPPNEAQLTTNPLDQHQPDPIDQVLINETIADDFD